MLQINLEVTSKIKKYLEIYKTWKNPGILSLGKCGNRRHYNHIAKSKSFEILHHKEKVIWAAPAAFYFLNLVNFFGAANIFLPTPTLLPSPFTVQNILFA